MDFVTFLIQLYGKGEDTARKLRKTGYTTPEKLSSLTPSELSDVTGLSVYSSRGMIKTAKGMLDDGGRRKARSPKIERLSGKKVKKAKSKVLTGSSKGKAHRTTKKGKSSPRTTAKIRKKGATRVSAGVTAEESDILTGHLASRESRKKKNEMTKKVISTFWRFG
jgi:hypothetical protein